MDCRTPREDACKSDDFVPPLTPDLWLVSWYSWERLAKGLVKERDAPTGKETVTTRIY